MINQSAFEHWSQEFTEFATELELRILAEYRKISNRWLSDETLIFDRRFQAFAEKEIEKWYNQSENWIFATLPIIYMRGITNVETELKSIGAKRNLNAPIPQPLFPRYVSELGDISDHTRKALSKYPKHWQAYQAYENGFKERIRMTRQPYLRSTVQGYRGIAQEVLKPAYINGDVATRRELSQRILNEFADRGIQTVTFPTGHRMSIEAFAEREARAYSNHVALQGQTNRTAERGYDLVRVNQYAGASPMCAPLQGGVYSLSGNSTKYASLSSVTHSGFYGYGSGLFHDYCGHSHSAYISGVSEKLGSLSDDKYEAKILNEMGEAKGNKFIFQQSQIQRYNERQIRLYKKKLAVSLDPKQKAHNQMLVKRWQARQRQLIEENRFLRRDYSREAVMVPK